MNTVSVEGRTLKSAIVSACEELSVSEASLRFKLDVSHFRDEHGKARGVDTVRIIAWSEGPVEVQVDEVIEAAPADAPEDVSEEIVAKAETVVSGSASSERASSDPSPSDADDAESDEEIAPAVDGEAVMAQVRDAVASILGI